MVNVCDNGTMLVTEWAIFVTKIRHLLKLVSDTNISKISPTSCHQLYHHRSPDFNKTILNGFPWRD